jgi:hypothetical protein
MIERLRRFWFNKVTGPRYKRRLRDGVLAVLEVKQMMIRARWPRQRRRHFLRDLERSPTAIVNILELIYYDKGKKNA